MIVGRYETSPLLDHPEGEMIGEIGDSTPSNAAYETMVGSRVIMVVKVDRMCDMCLLLYNQATWR